MDIDIAKLFENNGSLFWSGIPSVLVDLNQYGKTPKAYFSTEDKTLTEKAGVKTMRENTAEGIVYHTMVYTPKDLSSSVGKSRGFESLVNVLAKITQPDFARALDLHHGALVRLNRLGL